jgi:phosphoglycerol transferase
MSLPPYPRPGRCRDAATYGLSILLASALAAWLLELSGRDLHMPFLYGSGDVPSGQVWVKTLLDNSWLLHNDYLAAPDGQDFHDFPTSDGLQLLLLKGIGTLTGNVFLAVNLYFLLSFPLTAVTALFVLRRLGLSRGPALLAALLYAFLPYHFLRGQEHLFLAQYWMVPLLTWLALRISQDQGPFWSWHPQHNRVRRTWLSWDSLGAMLIALAGSSTGVYYAYFACFLLLAAAAAAVAARRRWHPLASAGVLIAIICAGVAGNVAPSVVYAWQHGRNPEAVQRAALDAERGGLKITALLLPTLDHRLPRLAKVRAAYDRSLAEANLPNQTSTSSLGLLAALGFVVLIGRAVLVRDRAGPTIMGGLATLNLAAVLLGTVGGFGMIVALAGGTWIRGYERISIVIAFFALTASALLLDRLARRLATTPGRRWAVRGGLAVLLLLGVLDQTSPAWLAPRPHMQAWFESDRAFVRQLEASVPPHSMIFQLPFMRYPESPRRHRLHAYDLARGYLHSRTLRWSFGAVQGRATAAWQERVAALPVEEMIRELRSTGFRGLSIDRAGYPDHAAELEADLTRLLGAARLESGNGRLVYYDLETSAIREPGTSATGAPGTCR